MSPVPLDLIRAYRDGTPRSEARKTFAHLGKRNIDRWYRAMEERSKGDHTRPLAISSLTREEMQIIARPLGCEVIDTDVLGIGGFPRGGEYAIKHDHGQNCRCEYCREVISA